MKLTDVAIRNALPKDKDYRLSDGLGLYLLVKPTGAKYWRMDYRFRNKRKTLAFGVYPKVKLKVAREKCHEARKLLDEGADPGKLKKEIKENLSPENTFKAIATEWHQKHKHNWVEKYAHNNLRGLELHVFPDIG